MDRENLQDKEKTQTVSTETAGKWEDRLARRRGKTEPGEQETAEEWEARHNG